MDSTNTSTTNVSTAASKINNEGEGGNLITDLINNLQIENEDNFDRWKLEEVLLKELSSLETANIDAVVTTDSQVNQILNGVDKTLEALDLVDSWLTVYKTELDGLSDDIFQIQTLNEMLQVQSKNQLDLLKELELVLGKTAVPNDLSDVLGKAHFDSEPEMKSIMLAAASLQRCLKTKYDDGTASMKAVNEQIDLTSLQSSNFSTRCFEYLKVMFAFQVDTSLNGAAKGGKLRIDMKSIKQELCKYRGLTLWLKEMDPRRHAELQVSYTGAISKIYSSEYRHLSQTFQSLASMRKSVRSEGADYLFSHDSSNRSKLGPSLHKRSNSDLASDNRTPPEIVIGQVLNIVIPDVIKEQNFFCLLFHIGLNPDSDFQTFVDNLAENTTLSDSDLFDLKNISKDIRIRKKLSENMTRMFDVLPQELAELSEMLNHQDPTLLIPLLTKLELFLEKTQDTNQEFLFSILQSLVKRSRDQFDLFIEEQVRAIKDSHLTVKKRSGILSFFRPFPVLLGRLENFLGNSQTQIRDQVNKAYKKIILVMFENLEASARASEAGGHDEKEQLNLHVITLENMHHFYSETRGFNKNPIISQFNKQSKEAYEHHLNLYTQNIINRPLKRLQEFFDGIESLLKSTSAEEVTYHVSYNKQSLKSIIKTHPAEDIRKGIHNMYKRVLKHMGEEERLLQVVWRNIQQSFLDEYNRYTKLIATCYGESNIQFEFNVNDLLQYFSNATR